jgi:hypothetical protein
VRRRNWALATAAVVLVAVAGVVVMSAAEHPASAARAPAADTVKVELGPLSAVVSSGGTLTYRGRPDGSPYAVINHAAGVYTSLPADGDRVDCGGTLYRVDDKPVLLLCGALPVYRALHLGMRGRDVRELNRDLHQRGGTTFTADTERALQALQRRKGQAATGRLDVGDAVFLPEAVRIARVTGEIGGAARPGAPVLSATSDTLHVQVSIDPSEQGEVKRGDRAQISLPGNVLITGRVAGFGRVAQAPSGQDSQPADATIPTFISLDDPARAGGLDKAPVQVDITTKGVDRALSVPVTALVGKSGGGFAVEVVRAGDRRELVAVRVGLFDDAQGRVQVEGHLRAGDRVVVPSI